ncbi:Vacuolar calcium ion transporter [Golovinomyces cichoracearum]|uniref:Vacuolar calcium ion transporter n=1 Tax=Golovinomyces cichoracearum TaxID=62708 RepID=A0A420HTW4_9PEZI|nr:Vacuolar calcium ion transporter [Golovinomyces cichoracearum]
MNSFTAHTLKRQARKEAWYGESWNPWRRNVRSSTWSGPITDIERDGGDHSPKRLSKVLSEPLKIMQGSFNDHGVQSEPVNNTVQELNNDAVGTVSPSDGALRARFGGTVQNSEINDAQEKAIEDETEKKRPWYAGKVLHHQPFTIKNQLQATIFNSWINILLIAAPVGIVCNYLKLSGTIIFIVNFIAIVPLAGLLGFATEEIALHVGESVGGLLNASFGNAVEIIVAVIALAKNEIVVVQTSLIGSILSNLLLVMGMCFFFGGLRRTEQFFNQTVAQTSASLLALSIGSIIIPTCFDLFTNSHTKLVRDIAALSRGTSVILLFVYGAYLYFQLHTHQTMFNVESQKVAMKPRKNTITRGSITKGLVGASVIGAGAARPQIAEESHNEISKIDAQETEKEEPEEPQLHIAVAWATLAGATAIIGLCAEFMVDGISSITEGGNISVEFVGLILLPIVGNAAEHATAVTVAVKDKMDLAIGVAVGSSMQIALLVIPLMIVIGWIMGKEEMNLSFDGFQVAVLFVSVLLVNYLISDGKSHWLEGMLLMCLYLIIAICAWYYPEIAR